MTVLTSLNPLMLGFAVSAQPKGDFKIEFPQRLGAREAKSSVDSATPKKIECCGYWRFCE
jgi:hypothetical protein